ncbi:MAG: alpha/beta hydrolase [Rhodocyclaceae bacterium]|nr:alpha/beta hydrolase [Rhodocyclaceae bacterium]
MSRTRFPELEVLVRAPEGIPKPTPLLFVHGAYAGAWCWQENYLPFFAQAGYACYALSLSGHGNSPGREWLDSLSLDDFVNDVVKVAGLLPEAPILIGHSMGGMVVQKYLERSLAPAAVLMASVPPQGLGSSAIGLAVRKPGLMMDLNRLMSGGQMAPDALLEILFAQPPAPEKLRAWYRRMQPESYRAIWDMTLFNLPRPRHMHRPPMLVLGAELDHLIPPTLVDMTARTYGLEAEIFPQMGHGMMLERNWLPVAERIRDWLAGNGL